MSCLNVSRFSLSPSCKPDYTMSSPDSPFHGIDLGPPIQVVVKSQILAGGRGLGKFKSGLQGGVHICSVDEAPKLAEQMLGQVLIQAFQLGECRHYELDGHLLHRKGLITDVICACRFLSQSRLAQQGSLSTPCTLPTR